MKKIVCVGAGLAALVLLAACNTPFPFNPLGAQYLNSITPTAAPKVATVSYGTTAGPSAQLGSPLSAFAEQYGQPTTFSKPPIYAFHDTNQSEGWPTGSQILVVMTNMQASEISYVSGTDHPMTYQEAQIFSVSVLPTDSAGPTTLQQENDGAGKCLTKLYTSKSLALEFPASDFVNPSGSTAPVGTATVTFFPDYEIKNNDNGTPITGDSIGGSTILSPIQVSSILITLGNAIVC